MKIGLFLIITNIGNGESIEERNSYLQDVETRKDVLVLEEAHHFELTKDTLGADQTLENVGELFEGYSLTVTRVGNRPDHSKSSIANGPVRQIICSIASRS